MHADVEKHRDQLIALCKQYDVARLEVFGSAARGGDFDPDQSDIDFLVEFQPDSDIPGFKRFFGLSNALTKLLHRRVDLVEVSAVRNPYIRARIQRSRELVYRA
jgi:predicted nucleotidyltransferase